MPGTYGEVNVKTLGALGNGVNDDTAALNQCIATFAQSNGGNLYLPPGIYPISSSLATTGISNLLFRGAGINATQIVRTGGFAGATFATLAGVVRCRDLSLPDFTVQGLNTPPAVPASTTPQTNPFPFDVEVWINGGTVSAASVNGNPIGIAATGFTVTLKAGETITLTYSVAPSWTWFGIGG